MKNLISVIIIFALILLLCSCSIKNQIETSSLPAEEESSETSTEGPTDRWSEKITRCRKKVYELMEENPDALTTVPKPSTHEPVTTQPIEGLPDCITEWIYNYFNYRVTYEVSDYFDYNGDMGDVLRFLTAMRRIENKPVDTFELVAYYVESSPITSDDWISVSVGISCSYKVYDDEKQDYITTDNDRIRATFNLIKENGEYTIENIKSISGEYYDYAVTCIYKTMGRFPEIDAYSKYEIVDFAIYEYTEKLYDFGVVPPV